MTHDTLTAMKQALEALKDACGGRCNAEYNPCWQQEAAQALRLAIEQAEKQEPGWQSLTDEEVSDEVSEYFGGHKTDGYYEIFARAIERMVRKKNAAPPQRQPLLFSRRKAIADKLGLNVTAEFNTIVREVERAHGIGGEA